MQNTGTIKRRCLLCGEDLNPPKGEQDNAWVCYKCNKKQLEERGLSEVNDEETKEKEEERWETQRALEEKGFLTIDEIARKSSISRRTIWNLIREHRSVFDITHVGRQIRINYKQFSKLHQDLKKRADWLCQEDEAVRLSLEKVAKFGDFTQVVSLEEAVKRTGFSRRYLRELISEHKIGYAELGQPDKYKTTDDLKSMPNKYYYDSYIRRLHRTPIVFVDLPSVLRIRHPLESDASDKPSNSSDGPALSPTHIARLAKLLPLLSEDGRKTINAVPENYKLMLAVECFKMENPYTWHFKKELLSHSISDELLLTENSDCLSKPGE